MDYENFKEQFVENLKEALYERGFEEAQMRENHVDKLNGGYDAMTNGYQTCSQFKSWWSRS